MTQIELIKAEIERRIEEYNIQSLRGAELSDLLSFITSHQHGQPSEDFGDAIYQYVHKQDFNKIRETPFTSVENAFKAGAQWQKEQMMKDAVEGKICGRVYDHINVRFADGVCKYLEPKNISHIPADLSKYHIGDKVKIIIVKED